MGQILLEGMEFYAYHGHFEEENIIGNRFVVDLIIETDTETASMTDNLRDAVNYQTAYQIVQREMGKKSRLLENIAGRILDALHNELRGIQKITVSVAKLNPPVGGKVHAVRVTLSR